MKKFSKSFHHILAEEKLRVKKEYATKFDREKRKLNKYYESAIKQKASSSRDTMPNNGNQLSNDIKEIYQNAVTAIKSIEKENALFEKCIEMEISSKKISNNNINNINNDKKVDLNKCQQLYMPKSKSTSSATKSNYASSSFEEDISEILHS
jgi:hypothetical protein